MTSTSPQPLDSGDQVNAAFRAPPHNYEAERALLGAILLNNRAFERVSEFLRPEHFTDPVNGHIFDASGRLIDQGHQANPVTLKTYLEQDPLVNAAGGFSYLTGLTSSVVTVINTGDYGRLIYDLYLRRELIAVGNDMVNDAYDADFDDPALAQIETSEQKLFDLASTGVIEGGFQSFDRALISAIDLAEAAHRRDGALAGVTTGLRDMDSKLGGLHSSDLIILAGRPSMGKTSLATNIAFNAAQHFNTSESAEDRGKLVAFFSLEMSSEQLATRILAERSRINSHDIRTGRLSNSDFERLVAASHELHDLSLYIDDTPAITVSAMRTRCRRLARQHSTEHHGGLGLVVVDYLQLLAPGRGGRNDNRVQEISSITRGLKALSKELDVPVLALSQLSRAVEQREDKRPQLSDLRESGSIEQDSDVVMFIYREQYYHARRQPTQREDEADAKFIDRMKRWQERGQQIHNKADIIIAKQRHGPIGSVTLFFDENFTLFDNLISDDQIPETRDNTSV